MRIYTKLSRKTSLLLILAFLLVGALCVLGGRLYDSFQTVAQVNVVLSPLTDALDTEFHANITSYLSKYCAIAFPETPFFVDGELGCNYERDYLIPTTSLDAVPSVVGRINAAVHTAFPRYSSNALVNNLRRTVDPNDNGYLTYGDNFQHDPNIDCTFDAEYFPEPNLPNEKISPLNNYQVILPPNLTSHSTVLQVSCGAKLSKVYYPFKELFLK